MPGVRATLFAVPGKVPLFMEGAEVQTDLMGEQTVGVEFSDGTSTFFYIPGCARLVPALEDRLRGGSLVLFDGTLWTDDEMITTGVGQKTGQRMGHMSVSGDDGTLAAFADIDVARKVFIHINTTNPILISDTEERRAVEAAGWEVSYDGMAITL